MRVLVCTNAMLGHFTPLVPLATALRLRGHDVLVASEPAFSEQVRSHGLEHVGVGRDLTLEDVFAVLPDIFEVSPADQDAYARPRVFIELRAMNVVADVDHLVPAWQPDIIVRESVELASWAVAERHGVPHVAVNVGAATSAQEWDVLARPWLRELGVRIGLDELDASSLYRHSLLSFEPAGYHDWSDTPTASIYGPAPVTAGQELGDAITALDERPIVYVTLGTEFYNEDLMRRLIAALVDGDRNIVATTGPKHDSAAVDPHQPNVIVARWIPQDALLDRAAAVVTHAGAGTVVGCLVRGLPVVCVPQGADQFHHARRVEELGVGISLGVTDREPMAIRRAVDTVLDDEGYRSRAARLAADTALLPGIDRAVHHVEQLAMG